jgi:DNA-binding transcriptional LysR family regulator
LQALQNEPFVLFPRRVAPGLHDQVMALCAHAGFVPHQVQEAKEWLTIVGLVDVGLGVSLVPASFERLQWGHVTYHEVDPGGHTTSISICRRATDPAPVLASFLTLAKEIFETR